MANDAAQLQGLSGACYLDSTNNYFAGRSCGLKVVNDAILNDALADDCENLAAIVGITLLAGDFIPGTFTMVHLSSGVVCLPNAQSGNTVTAVP